ncbi:MAG TPA: hypothetical protein VMR95_02855 [Candidatus Binatia bacterium]|nr:hypothetical protein [Candidatus Binatia bacterium]
MHYSANLSGMEDEAESLLPKKIKRTARKFPILYLVLSIALIIVIVVLSIALIGSNKHLNDQTADLTSLRTNLSKTKAGQAVLQQATNQANNNAAIASAAATTAQNQASTEASQLSTTQGELSSSQSQLNSVNTKLASAESCVSLFNTTTPTISSYNSNMKTALSDITQAAIDANGGDYSDATSLVTESESYYDSAQTTFTSIQSVLDEVGSDSCSL